MSIPLLAIMGFAAASSFTPGPNNVMVAASGANHGLRATLPHCAGIIAGFSLMVLLVGFGVAGLLATVPAISAALRWVALGWLLIGPPGSGAARPPMSLLSGAAFQWVNPKAWLMAVGANAAFVSARDPLLPQVAALAGVFCLISVPSILGWAALGSAAARLLTSRRRLRAFNWVMAGLMVASMLPVAFE